MRTASRLAHGWEWVHSSGVPKSLIDFVCPAIRAVPARMAQRLGHFRIRFVRQFDDPISTSQWSETDNGVDVAVATFDADEHDVVVELLVCLGQVLWERLFPVERDAYWKLIDTEIREGVEGEIDEDALSAKRALIANTAHEGSAQYLEQYGQASFAATAAEYVHCMWHDVTIRTGPDYLPAIHLRRRLRLLARWFRPNPGYRLFPRPRATRR